MDKDRAQGGAKKRKGWPLDLDTHDPEQVASFSLGLGYPVNDVVNTLVQRCNLDRITARQIVNDTARQLQGGGQS